MEAVLLYFGVNLSREYRFRPKIHLRNLVFDIRVYNNCFLSSQETLDPPKVQITGSTTRTLDASWMDGDTVQKFIVMIKSVTEPEYMEVSLGIYYLISMLKCFVVIITK